MFICNNAWRIEKDFILTKSNGGLHAGLGGINYCFYFLVIFKKKSVLYTCGEYANSEKWIKTEPFSLNTEITNHNI
jgi:hypothetical protein